MFEEIFKDNSKEIEDQHLELIKNSGQKTLYNKLIAERNGYFFISCNDIFNFLNSKNIKDKKFKYKEYPNSYQSNYLFYSYKKENFLKKALNFIFNRKPSSSESRLQGSLIFNFCELIPLENLEEINLASEYFNEINICNFILPEKSVEMEYYFALGKINGLDGEFFITEWKKDF